MELYKIKLSQNSDKDYEYFWMTLKDILLNFTNSELGKDMNIVSDILNTLKKNKKYSEISCYINKFILENIDEICSLLILTQNPTYISRFITNVKKWIVLMEERKNQLFIDNFLFNFLVVLNGYIKHSKKIKYIELSHLICQYHKKLIDLDVIFLYSINNKLVSMVDFLKDYINLQKYFCNFDNYNINKKTKGLKLIQVIKDKTKT